MEKIMILTIILSIIMMAGLFLMLLAGVAFVQDKRFFTSAPKDVQEVIQPREERFAGQHALGWVLMMISVVLMAGSLIYAGWDGIQLGFTFGQFFTRYAVIVILLKAFDILFFDWVLLCHSSFYPHFFPECKELVGPQQFGFNKKSHVVQIVGFIVLAAVFAWICTMF